MALHITESKGKSYTLAYKVLHELQCPPPHLTPSPSLTSITLHLTHCSNASYLLTYEHIMIFSPSDLYAKCSSI